MEKKKIAHVAAGTHHSLCLDLTGQNLYSFGRADYGQLGITFDVPKEGAFANTPNPVYLHHRSSKNGLVQVNPRIRSISCGEHHCLAVTEKGELYTWGFGLMGQLGHPSHEEYICLPKKVNAKGMDHLLQACGGCSHSIVLDGNPGIDKDAIATPVKVLPLKVLND